MEFDSPNALQALSDLDPAQLDALAFGVVGMGPDGTVLHYNQAEAEYAGLSLSDVVGTNFFFEVAPCMNNFMVAQKMLDEPELDETIPYVLTLKMKPTPVTLRLLKARDTETMYLLVRR